MTTYRPLSPLELGNMPWTAYQRRMDLWRRLILEYGRIHHDTYHVTRRTRKPSCSCPFGRCNPCA